jgi:GNAT superfamily N-acetyltransferase
MIRAATTSDLAEIRALIRELAAYERAGHGKALLAALAATCRRNGYERFEWWVLAWNEPTIQFYTSLGVELLKEWTVCRLSGEPLEHLAAEAPAVANQLSAS